MLHLCYSSPPPYPDLILFFSPGTGNKSFAIQLIAVAAYLLLTALNCYQVSHPEVKESHNRPGLEKRLTKSFLSFLADLAKIISYSGVSSAVELLQLARLVEIPLLVILMNE